MRAAKVDANHGEVVDALRAAGATVQSLAALGAGVPDLLVGAKNRDGARVNILMEVKDGRKPPSARRLTPDQQIWHALWQGSPVVIVTCQESALKALAGYEVSITEKPND